MVSANAELLVRQIGENQWLQNIQYENERMGMLVGQLLDLARTENVTPQMEHIDFSRLVAGEALPFESVAFEKELALNTAITSGIAVEGNGAQLKQLTSILLDNAIRHSKPAGEVRLTLTKDQKTGDGSLSWRLKTQNRPLSLRGMNWLRHELRLTAHFGGQFKSWSKARNHDAKHQFMTQSVNSSNEIKKSK